MNRSVRLRIVRLRIAVVGLPALLGFASCKESDMRSDPTPVLDGSLLDSSVSEGGGEKTDASDDDVDASNDGGVTADGEAAGCTLSGSSCGPDPNCCPPISGNRFHNDSGSGCLEKTADALACMGVGSPKCFSQNLVECFVSRADSTAIFVVSERGGGEIAGFEKCPAAITEKATHAPICQ